MRKNVHFDATSDFWVFENITAAGLSIVSRTIKTELKQEVSLDIAEPVFTELTVSLQKQLKQLLGPIFQADYTGFVQMCEERGLIPANRTEAQNTKIKQWFLHTMQEEGVDRLFRSNPYIHKKAQDIVEHWLKNTVGFFKRLERDQEELRKQVSLSGHGFKIKALQLDLSDPHNSHQSVKIVELDNGHKFVYKPRSLAAEDSFYSWVNYLNNSGKLPTKPYRPWLIDKSAYGWMEFIHPLTQIEDHFDHFSYASQFGILSVLWYMVGGTDLHHENIVFGEKGVVIVDCETIFEADFFYLLKPAALQQRLEPDAYKHTILSSGAFSILASDLNAHKETIVQNGGIAKFRSLISVSSLEKNGAKTQSTLSKDISWNTVTDSICKSIDSTFSYFREQDPKLVLRLIKKYFSNGTPTRVVLRPTASYGVLLLNLSKKYEVLKKATSAQHYIKSQLDQAPETHAISSEGDPFVQAEIDQLADFNIPYFGRELGKNKLTTTTGLKYTFDKNLNFRSLQYRLRWLQEDNSFIKNEVQLAKMALSPHSVLSNYVCVSPEQKEVKEYYKYGVSIYDYLPRLKTDHTGVLSELADKVLHEIENANDVDHAFCIMAFDEQPDMCQPTPMSYSLFQGLSGKFLFLGLYAHIMSRPDLIRFINEKAEYFVDLGKNAFYVKEKSPQGIAGGYQSLLYAFEHLRLLGILDIDFLDQHLTTLSPGPRTTKNHDLLASISGNVLLAAFFVDRLPPDTIQSWSRQLKKTVKDLIVEWDTKQDKKRLGLAHGSLGACLAASRLYSLSPMDEELKRLTLHLLDLESKLFKESVRSKEFNRATYGWCYGESGRALTYYKVGKSFGHTDLIAKAKNLASIENNDLHFRNHTLCCGSLGFIATHLSVYGDLPEYQNTSYRIEKINQFYKNPVKLLEKSEQKSQCIMPSGLFYGLSGLGVVLLYAMRPDIVPAVWLFE